jgi:hypothetical protein
MSALTEQLRHARGKRYYDILRLVLADVGALIVTDARAVIASTGTLTTLDIGVLSVRYDLNYKATVEWLEENQVLPTGTYEKMLDSGLGTRLKVGEILAAARQQQGAKRPPHPPKEAQPRPPPPPSSPPSPWSCYLAAAQQVTRRLSSTAYSCR